MKDCEERDLRQICPDEEVREDEQGQKDTW